MHLRAELSERAATEASAFLAVLFREDCARLERLAALAAEGADRERFVKEGMRVGWTRGNLRTHELKARLVPFLESVYAYETGGRTDEQDRAVRAAWAELHRERLEKLAGCN